MSNTGPFPLLKVEAVAGAHRVIGAGAWTAPNAAALADSLATAFEAATSASTIALDLTAVTAFDTFGASHVARVTRAARARGQTVTVSGLANAFQALLSVVERAHSDDISPEAPSNPLARVLDSIGRKTSDAWSSLVLLINMLGAIAVAALRTLRHPSTFRLTSTVHHLDRVGLRAVPIILLITFLIGAIIAQQGFFHFRKFGADDYVVDMVGILVLREIGVLIVAIMVAGRSGSSYTAELGSMKMREEIDALRTMGFDPVQILVLPRVLALVIALPILTFLGALSALYGGQLVAWLYGGMSPDIFVARLKDAISITHFNVGMIKAPFMALIIGVVACTEGLRVGGSAESLGLRTTASVVTAIFLVIVLDGLFAIFFASIGM